MVKCAVAGCTNYQPRGQVDKTLKFFCFPKDDALCQKWIDACGEVEPFNYKASRICSDHFTEQDWKLEHVLLNISDDKKRLKLGAVPTQKLPNHSASVDEDLKKHKKLVAQALSSYEEPEVNDLSSNSYRAGVSTPAQAKSKPVPQKIILEATNVLPSELQTLKSQNTSLRKEALKLLSRVRKAEAVVANMEKLFTKGQLKRLKYPQKNCNWNYEDVAVSISLFTASPLMYQMLWKKKYPLPSPSTLRKWAATLKLRPGLIVSTVKALTDCNYDERDRLCILAFYEIRLKAPAHPDDPIDTGLRPYRYAQVFIMRGLVSEWKQIIYYNFDCMMPGLILKDIIRTLKDIRFTVVAVVSGVGPRKIALWKEIKVNEEHPWFEVFPGEKIFFFANPPHLIKRIRNHFLETGLLVNGVKINVDPLSEMLIVEPSELWVSHDLTQAHISANKVGRHNMQMVSQLFSQAVADSIKKCVAMGKMYTQNAIECSDFIQLVDEWFRVFNSKYMNDTGMRGPLPYGQALEEQNATIIAMNKIVKNIKVPGAEHKLQLFQKGILLNNCSLPLFYEYLKQKHKVAFVITNNLNADDIEHSFAIRKSYGGIAHQPTPIEFKYRLRAGILMNLNTGY